MARSGTLVFFCNGIRIKEKDVDPDMTLLDYLRSKLRLTGTKAGCNQGGCGSCTVMVSSAHPTTKEISHMAVMACLYPLCLIHGKAVTTIEGLGSAGTGLHAVQECLAKSRTNLCHFCSPGIMMSMYTLLRNNPRPTMEDVLTSVEGNLCRCSSYRPILDSFRSFCGENCECARQEKAKDKEPEQLFTASEVSETVHQSDTSYDPTQEPIFPPELLTNSTELTKSVTFERDRVRWMIPASLEELLHLKKQHQDAPMIVGNTIMGNSKRAKCATFPLVISPGPAIVELTQVKTSDLGVTIGGSTTMTQLENGLKKLIKDLPEHQTRTLRAIVTLVQRYASPQIRNVASLGGTIWSFSKRGDLVPVFMVCGATATLMEVDGERKVPLDETYRAKTGTIMKPCEIAKDVFIPFTKQNEFCYSYKLGQRKRNCLATVNCGCFVTMDATNPLRISTFVIMFGGDKSLGPIKFSDRLLNQDFLKEVLSRLSTQAAQELRPSDFDLNSVNFLRSLMAACLVKSFVRLCRDTQNDETILHETTLGIPLHDPSLISSADPGVPGSAEVCQFPPSGDGQNEDSAVECPPESHSRNELSCEEAVFVDDIPPLDGELSAAPVLSIRPHANILSVDTSQALALPGVVDFVTHLDIPGVNGQVMDLAEECFVSSKVQSVGQLIGVTVADSRQTALKAAKLVRVQYEDIDPVIRTIEDAITHNSMLEPEPKVLTRGDVEGAITSNTSCILLEGELHVGGQDHAYLEPRVCIAEPLEADGMSITVTSENLTHVQLNAAHCLGVPASCVKCQARRLGGAFGGKGSRIQYAVATAVAARKTGRPVRLALSRQDDTLMKGFRSAVLVKYQVGFSEEGRIGGLDVRLYMDCGWSLDVSGDVLEHAMFHLGNVYSIDHLRVTGYLCKTNRPSNTAMTGFGVPQVTACMQHIISDIALSCNITQREAHEINFGTDWQTRSQDQVPSPGIPALKRCWDQCLEESEYQKRRDVIQAFNRTNRWRKRGIAIVPVKFGVDQQHSLDQSTTAAKDAEPRSPVDGHNRDGAVTQNVETQRRRPFFSQAHGAAVSEVEVDCLTGEHRALCTYVVVATAPGFRSSLSEGEMEGAFIQGYGFFTMEQLKLSREGAPLTLLPQTYKIPLASDLPSSFRITLLQDSSGGADSRTAGAREGTSDLLVCLASATFFAIKDAVAAARSDAGLGGPFRLDVPAGPEGIRTGCGDPFGMTVGKDE
ncbi:xanthine dehydrogenase/oxidase-like [Diadema setosum]|uniref:xanthine dehydrogenase/oxidase-like n=1 Tax=Diadema setosum TaxID=31175 RepID=UPI003B3BDAB7